MAVNKLLVAFDESEGADRALAMAASLAAVNPEAHVDVVYVVPIPLLDETQMANFKDILDMMISDGEDLLAEAEQKMGEDVAARTDSLLLTGTNPATEIVKLIGQRDYDLLIVGNRGLSGLKEYMGSVSHKLLHASPIPVLLSWASGGGFWWGGGGAWTGLRRIRTALTRAPTACGARSPPVLRMFADARSDERFGLSPWRSVRVPQLA